jgi:hypothetical protein
MEKDGDSEEDNDEEVVKQVLKRRFEGRGYKGRSKRGGENSFLPALFLIPVSCAFQHLANLSFSRCSVLQNFKIFTHLLPNFSYKDPRFNIFGTFLTLSLKLMQWYVTSVSRGSLYEKFCNKCVKILKIACVDPI